MKQQQQQQQTSAPLVELLIAIHKVSTPMGRKRTGLCSAFLAEEQQHDAEKQSCRVVLGFIERGVHTLGPVADPASCAAAPMILVGPGTGIAPIRAVVQRRCATASTAPTLVFTGHRHPDKDFAFRDEWEQLASSSASPVEFVHAFSRFTPPPAAASQKKGSLSVDRDSSPPPTGASAAGAFASYTGEYKYVQHAIASNRMRGRVASMLLNEACVVIVSGNAKQMPKDVLDALALCLQQDAGFVASLRDSSEEDEDGSGAPSSSLTAEEIEDAAKEHLERMRKTGRYIVDAWA
jgi:sulfite reductase alpha subunit-like flavoprotein